MPSAEKEVRERIEELTRLLPQWCRLERSAMSGGGDGWLLVIERQDSAERRKQLEGIVMDRT